MTLAAVLGLLATLLSCSVRQGEDAIRDNPYDAGGLSWSRDEAPVIDTVAIDSVPLWSDFEYPDSTGSVVLAVRAHDPNGARDHLTYRLLVGTAVGIFTDTLRGGPTFSLTGLVPDTRYLCRVEVRDSWDSVDVAERQFTTAAGLPPDEVRGVHVSGSVGIDVQWNCSPGGVTGYRVFRSEVPGDLGTLLLDTSCTGTDSVIRFTDWGVIDHEVHYYRIGVSNAYGQNLTAALPGWRQFSVVGYSSATVAYIGPMSARVSWQCLSVSYGEDETTRFLVLRRDSGATTDELVASVARSCEACTLSVLDTVPSAASYCYAVVGLDSAGRAGARITACLQPMAEPLGLSDSASDCCVLLAWSSVSGAIGYFIYRSDPLPASAGALRLLDSTGGVNNTWFRDSVPTADIFTYAVAARDSAGRSGYLSGTIAAQRTTP
jgi:hypothetical protein